MPRSNPAAAARASSSQPETTANSTACSTGSRTLHSSRSTSTRSAARPGDVTAPCAVQTPPPNQAAAGPGDRRVRSSPSWRGRSPTARASGGRAACSPRGPFLVAARAGHDDDDEFRIEPREPGSRLPGHHDGAAELPADDQGGEDRREILKAVLRLAWARSRKGEDPLIDEASSAHLGGRRRVRRAAEDRNLTQLRILVGRPARSSPFTAARRCKS